MAVVSFIKSFINFVFPALGSKSINWLSHENANQFFLGWHFNVWNRYFTFVLTNK